MKNEGGAMKNEGRTWYIMAHLDTSLPIPMVTGVFKYTTRSPCLHSKYTPILLATCKLQGLEDKDQAVQDALELNGHGWAYSFYIGQTSVRVGGLG